MTCKLSLLGRVGTWLTIKFLERTSPFLPPDTLITFNNYVFIGKRTVLLKLLRGCLQCLYLIVILFCCRCQKWRFKSAACTRRVGNVWEPRILTVAGARWKISKPFYFKLSLDECTQYCVQCLICLGANRDPISDALQLCKCNWKF